MDVGFDGGGYVPWAAAAVACWNRHVLLAIDAEGDREALYGRSEPRLPQHLAVIDIHCFQTSIETSRKGHSARRGKHRQQERRALLDRPEFLHRPHIEGRQLADVSIVAWHFIETPRGPTGTAAAFF